MEKLIGYIATVSEVTQDGAESVGTFYKTLFARMGNVKAGRYVDDETGESLNDVEKVLSKNGVYLRDSKNEFKEFGVVLDEVGQKWNSYDEVTRRAIATAFAGTRQQEKFIVLMENYGAATEYTITALESGGTAAEKFSNYTESIEGKLNALKAAFEELSMTILNSDWLITGIEILSKFVNILNDILSWNDGMIVKIAAIAGGIALLYTGFNKLSTMILKTINHLSRLIHVTQTLGAAGHSASSFSVMGGIIAKSINPIGLTAVALVGLVAALTAINNASTNARKKAVEAANEAKSAWQNYTNELESTENEIQSVADRIAELQKLRDAGTITLVEQNELDRLNATLDRLEVGKSTLKGLIDQANEDKERTATDAINALFDERLSDAYVQDNNTFGMGVYRVLGTLFGGFGGAAYTGPSMADWAKVNKQEDYIGALLTLQQGGEELSDEQASRLNSFFTSLNTQIDSLSYHHGDNLMDWQKDANAAYSKAYQYMHRLSISRGDDVWNSILGMDPFTHGVDANGNIITKSLKSRLTQLADNGDVTISSLKQLYTNDTQFKEFIDYLQTLGLFSWDSDEKVAELVNQIKAMSTSVGSDDEGSTPPLTQTKEELEGILDKYQELIDLRKELLETYKEELEYEEELAKKQKNVSTLSAQLTLARLDTSAAGQARARELQAELDEAEAELDDFTLEHAIDVITNDLDSQAAEFKIFIEEQIDRIVGGLNGDTGSYHSGGFVGGLESNEEYAKLLKGEFVSTPAMMKNFVENTLPAVASYGGTQINSPLVTIQCGSITEDSLPQFEHIVNQAVKEVERKLNSGMSRTGYKHRVKSLN